MSYLTSFNFFIPKHLGSFSFHFPLTQLLIFRPNSLNSPRQIYLALASLRFIAITVWSFGGLCWRSLNSFTHPRSEMKDRIR